MLFGMRQMARNRRQIRIWTCFMRCFLVYASVYLKTKLNNTCLRIRREQFSVSRSV
jgi:hypothetical protein